MTNTHPSFFGSPGGRAVVTLVSALVIWGIMVVGAATNFMPLLLAISFVCVYFGWRALNRIQPSMFLWMSLFGWMVYFFIKFVLAMLIGFVVAPFALGSRISRRVQNRSNGQAG